MSSRDFAAQLEEIADRIGDVPRAELVVLLRRAAIRLRNAGAIALDEDIQRALVSFAREQQTTEAGAIRSILRLWLAENDFLSTQGGRENL